MSRKHLVTASCTVIFFAFGFAANINPGGNQGIDTSQGAGQYGDDTSGTPDEHDNRGGETSGDSMSIDSGSGGGAGSRGYGGMRDNGDSGVSGSGGNAGCCVNNQGGYGNQGFGGAGAYGNQGYGGRSAGYGNQGFAGMNPQGAVIPQYLVADASLFLVNAVNTARIMQQEGKLSMQDANMIRSQAIYLHDILGRAIQDLQLLQSDAERSNPKAAESIRETITQLTAAEGQINNISSTANQGNLSLACTTTVNAVLGNLQNAQKSLPKIGDAYNATGFTSLGQCPSAATSRKSSALSAAPRKKVNK